MAWQSPLLRRRIFGGKAGFGDPALHFRLHDSGSGQYRAAGSPRIARGTRSDIPGPPDGPAQNLENDWAQSWKLAHL